MLVVLYFRKALGTTTAKDNLRLFDYSWYPIWQEAGFLTLDAGNVYHCSTFDADKMMMPAQVDFIKGGTRTCICQHYQTSADKHIDDIIDGGARQRGASYL